MFNSLIISKLGLDIYFHKCKRHEWDTYQNELEAYDNLPEEEQDKTEHPGRNFVADEIGYFRKVNFLMNELAYYGNCEYKEITRDQLEELQDKCTRLATITPHESEEKEYDEEDVTLAQKTLPTCSGFFFGSTDYDEWYFNDVKEVLEWVNGVLDALDDDEVVLMYCWW